MVDEFQVFSRRLTPIEVAQLHDGRSLADLLKRTSDALSKDQRASLLRYYLATIDSEYRKQLTALRTVREERSKSVDGITEIMVMRELVPPRQSHRLKRRSLWSLLWHKSKLGILSWHFLFTTTTEKTKNR